MAAIALLRACAHIRGDRAAQVVCFDLARMVIAEVIASWLGALRRHADGIEAGAKRTLHSLIV